MANVSMEQYLRGLQRFPALQTRELRAELNDFGAEVTTEARQNHDFKTRSGMGERSIQFELDRSKPIVSIFLEDRLTMTERGVGYMVYQHEGTYKGYKQSPMSPRYTPTLTATGIQADHFLWTPLKKGLPDLNKRLEKVPQKAWQEAMR